MNHLDKNYHTSNTNDKSDDDYAIKNEMQSFCDEVVELQHTN